MINKYLMVQGAGREGDRRQLMGGGASQLRKENTRNCSPTYLPTTIAKIRMRMRRKMRMRIRNKNEEEQVS